MSEQNRTPPKPPADTPNVDADADAILRDEAQTERQAPNDASPGEAAD